jgi:hypothetical protein
MHAIFFLKFIFVASIDTDQCSSDVFHRHPRISVTVVGANLYVSCPLEVKGKVIRGVRGVADKEACTVRTINIIPQRQ